MFKTGLLIWRFSIEIGIWRLNGQFKAILIFLIIRALLKDVRKYSNLSLDISDIFYNNIMVYN